MGRERGREMWGRGKRRAYLCDSKAIKADWGEGGGSIQLFPEGEVNSGGYIPRREASRYISTALHRP